jgi:hypothetical protein
MSWLNDIFSGFKAALPLSPGPCETLNTEKDARTKVGDGSCTDTLYAFAEFAAVAFFWNVFRWNKSEGAVWVSPTPCHDDSDETNPAASEASSFLAEILNQVPPFGKNVFFTPNYSCKGHEQEKLCDALKSNFRNKPENPNRKPDALAINRERNYGELLEVTTGKSWSNSPGRKRKQFQTALDLLNDKVNLKLRELMPSSPSPDWEAASKDARIEWPLFLLPTSPRFRWICYLPTNRQNAPQGWVLYEVHWKDLSGINLMPEALEALAKAALGAVLMKKLIDFLTKELPKTARNLGSVMEKILEEADRLIQAANGLLNQVVIFLCEHWKTIVVFAMFAVILVKIGFLLAPTVLAFLAVAIVFAIVVPDAKARSRETSLTRT